MDIQEIIDLLESIIKYYTKKDGCSRAPMYVKQQVDQALTLLKQQPTAGEFTKTIRHNLRVQSRAGDTHRLGNIYTELLKKACDRLDTETEVSLKSLEACTLANIENAKLQSRLDTAEAINKDLLEACEKVQDWLDTSSLQQILVHHTEDKRRYALIMGIASNLERLEAAIARAKKDIKRDGTIPPL
jgi:hypothetical protein